MVFVTAPPIYIQESNISTDTQIVERFAVIKESFLFPSLNVDRCGTPFRIQKKEHTTLNSPILGLHQMNNIYVEAERDYILSEGYLNHVTSLEA
ncbi:hypothetical protein ACOME3_001561 [Neoechinorhynchus agilis]